MVIKPALSLSYCQCYAHTGVHNNKKHYRCPGGPIQATTLFDILTVIICSRTIPITAQVKIVNLRMCQVLQT